MITATNKFSSESKFNRQFGSLQKQSKDNSFLLLMTIEAKVQRYGTQTRKQDSILTQQMTHFNLY